MEPREREPREPREQREKINVDDFIPEELKNLLQMQIDAAPHQEVMKFIAYNMDDKNQENVTELYKNKEFQEVLNYIEMYKFNDSISYNWKGGCYSALGDHVQAMQSYNRAILLSPQSLILRFNRAVAYYAAGRYDRCIEDCDYILKKNPKNSEAWNWKGQSSYKLNDCEGAVKAYTAALELDPTSTLYLGNRATAYKALKMFDKCVADLDAAIAINPEDDLLQQMKEAVTNPQITQ